MVVVGKFVVGSCEVPEMYLDPRGGVGCVACRSLATAAKAVVLVVALLGFGMTLVAGFVLSYTQGDVSAGGGKLTLGDANLELRGGVGWGLLRTDKGVSAKVSLVIVDGVAAGCEILFLHVDCVLRNDEEFDEDVDDAEDGMGGREGACCCRGPLEGV